MRRLHPRAAHALLAGVVLASPMAQAATVDTFMLTPNAPGSAPCLQLPATLTGLRAVPVATAQVQAFYLLKDLRRGDVVSTRYTRPDGTVADSLTTRRPPHPQDSAVACWWDALAVAGAALGAAPGTWTATLLVNGSAVASLPFSVEGAPPAAPVRRGTPVIVPLPPAASAPAAAACTLLRLVSDRAAEIRIPLDQVDYIDWTPALNDGSVSAGLPEARRGAAAMQIHLIGGRVERVELVHPPQIRFVCGLPRP